MLGAAVGSARLHLHADFPKLQAELNTRIEICARELVAAKLPLASTGQTPIFQAQCDSPRLAFSVAQRMKERGFYCCICTVPAVPANHPGLRFTVSRHNHVADIGQFVLALLESFAEARHRLLRAAASERDDAEAQAPTRA